MMKKMSSMLEGEPLKSTTAFPSRLVVEDKYHGVGEIGGAR